MEYLHTTPLHSDAGQNACTQEELKLKHLLLLRDAFTRHTTSDRGSRRSWRGARKKGGGERGMSLEEFQKALSAVIGPDSQSGWLERVFNEVTMALCYIRLNCFLLVYP